MSNKLSALLILIAITGCQNIPAWKYSMFDRPAGNYNYPPLYLSGWRDGCESGAQASANHFYRMKYKFKQDWQLISDQVYRTGWDNAYNQCRKYILQHNMNIEHAAQQPQQEEESNLWAWK